MEATSSDGAPPDGQTVSFMEGATVLGTGRLGGGSARFATSALSVGTDSITAVYGGDWNFARSTSRAVSQVVSQGRVAVPEKLVDESASVASRLILYNNHPLPPPCQGGEPPLQLPSSLRRGPGGGERTWPVNA